MDSIKAFFDLTFLHNSVADYLRFAGIILIAIIFKRFISKLVSKVVYKVFSRFLHGESVQQFLTLLLRPVEFLLIVLAAFFAFNTLNIPELEKAEKLQNILNIAFQVLIVIAFTRVILNVVNFLTTILQQMAEKTESTVDDQIIHFVREAAKIVIWLFSILFIISSVFNLNIGTLIAGLGIGGLAVALAAQDTLENVIASFVIFLDKPFQVGDYINVGETYGIVEKIGFRSTRIRTLEKSYLTVPNKSLINRELDNLSLRTFRRAKFSVGLLYSTPVDKIKAIVKDIQEYLDKHELTNEDGLARFEEFGDSSLNVMVVYYVKTQEWAEYLQVKEDINFKIMEIVQKHGSDFAFPTRTVHMVKES